MIRLRNNPFIVVVIFMFLSSCGLGQNTEKKQDVAADSGVREETYNDSIGNKTNDVVIEPYDSIKLDIDELGLDVSVQKHMNMSDDGILRMKIYDRVGKLLHHFKLENANEYAMELFRGEKPEYVYLYSVSGNASFGNILMIDIKRGCELKEIFETRIGVVDVKRFRRGFIVKQYINGRWVDKNYDEYHTITIDFDGKVISDKKEITEMAIPYVSQD